MNYIITVGDQFWTGEELSDKKSSAKVFKNLDDAVNAADSLPEEIRILASYKQI